MSPYSNANSARSPNRAFQGDDVLDELRATLPAFAKEGLDVLVSHGPPAGILDKGAGSDALAQLVRETAPRYHVFGHQHNCFGTIVKGRTCFVNASSTDGLFALCKPPLVVDVVAEDAAAMAPSRASSTSIGAWAARACELSCFLVICSRVGQHKTGTDGGGGGGEPGGDC